jgi:hypothetical protein
MDGTSCVNGARSRHNQQVVDEQERCILRSDEVVGERVTRGTGHGSGTFSKRGSVRPELAAATISRCHLILVIRSPDELADLEHVQAEPLDLCEHAV